MPVAATAVRRRALLAGAVAAGVPGGARATASGPLPLADYDFLAERRARPTRLLRHGPSDQPYTAEPPPAGAERLPYESGGRTLWGLWGMPARRRDGRPAPVLVYAHGGFAFDNSEYAQLRSYLDRGFAVFTPTFRAENGNGGDFELMRGEVDDLAAAVRRAAEQQGVDRERIFVFGHSVGGGLSDLLALFPGLPIRASGSAGALYFPGNLRPDERDPLFPPDDPWERLLRSMVPSARQLTRRHLGIKGSDEGLADEAEAVNSQMRAVGAPLQMAVVPGDHFEALRPALELFLARIEAGEI